MGSLADQLKDLLGASELEAEHAESELGRQNPAHLLRVLLMKAMLRDVFEEPVGQAEPSWIGRWRELAEVAFPFIDAAAMERLLAAGVDAKDLTDFGALRPAADRLQHCRAAGLAATRSARRASRARGHRELEARVRAQRRLLA
ncbi:MAG: hypothetical protein QM756_17435 [Polyangiaceae bacterium]